jgi:hypothetical protein
MLCEACLRSVVQSHPLNLPIDISTHAGIRFEERCQRLGHKSQSCAQVIRRMYWDSRPIVFTDQYMRERWFTGGDACYYLSSNFVLVVTPEKPFNLKTIEPIGGKKLGEDYWYLIEENCCRQSVN